MKQFKHIWLFKSYRFTDDNDRKFYLCQEFIFLHTEKFGEDKIKEHKQYSWLIQKGYQLISFHVEEVDAFSCFYYSESDPSIEDDD